MRLAALTILVILTTACAGSPTGPSTVINSVVDAPHAPAPPVTEATHPWDNGGPYGDSCRLIEPAPECPRGCHPMCRKTVYEDKRPETFDWICVPEWAFWSK